MHVWNVLHAARWKYRTQKIAICAPSHNFVGPYLRKYCTYRQSEKSLLSSNMSSICAYNMVNVGPLTAEIRWRVWGTPANFNGFRVLAALLHGTLVVSVSQTLRSWTEGATYIRQGGHHVGHWPTFWLTVKFLCSFKWPNFTHLCDCVTVALYVLTKTRNLHSRRLFSVRATSPSSFTFAAHLPISMQSGSSNPFRQSGI